MPTSFFVSRARLAEGVWRLFISPDGIIGYHQRYLKGGTVSLYLEGNEASDSRVEHRVYNVEGAGDIVGHAVYCNGSYHIANP